MTAQTEQYDPSLYNADLAPTASAERTWRWLHIAALWFSMVVCVPSYMLASGMIAQGMSSAQAILTVLLGNVVVLLPMLVVGHAGARYGVPFPVLLRASFGTIGARVPALLRGLVGCGWFGIQAWIGGAAVYSALVILIGPGLGGPDLPGLGINLGQMLCFLAFWGLHVWFIWHGTEAIRRLETWAAPVLLALALALFGWGLHVGGGLGPVLAAGDRLSGEGAFAAVFWPSLTAVVGYWATMALNIADFTRFARSQRDQLVGQAVGLPVPMGLFGLIGVSVTGASLLVYGEAIWDPVALTQRMGGTAVLIGMVALAIATLTTNIAANVVAPANGFCNLAPGRLSFRAAGLVTALLGIVIMPWRLVEDVGDYVFVWLVGYSSLLGPIAGIMIVDYLLVRRGRMDTQALFARDGAYSYRGGWNPAAFLALGLGVLPNLPGFLHAIKVWPGAPAAAVGLYSYAWFIGFAVSAVVYGLLQAGAGRLRPVLKPAS